MIALDLAKYIVTKCVKDNCAISNLQLQKILYFIQRDFLRCDKPAFSDAIEGDLALKIFTDDFDRFSPATRARILLARASWCYDNQKKDLIAAAHEADGKDIPVLLGSVRREIAHAVANSRQILEGLPSWAIVTIDTEMRSRIESWLNCDNLYIWMLIMETRLI